MLPMLLIVPSALHLVGTKEIRIKVPSRMVGGVLTRDIVRAGRALAVGVVMVVLYRWNLVL